MSKENQSGLPYKEITQVATRDQVRSKYNRGRETIFIPYKSLKVREGFNVRNEYGDIEGLANSLEARGLETPLLVDVLPNGTVYVEIGHRRLRALTLLHERGKLKDIYAGGLRNGMVECFVNRGEVSELDRLLRQYSSNHQEAYSVLDIADLALRLKTYFEITHDEIAKRLGISRQQVDNLVKLAQEPADIRQAIKEGKITPTAAIDLIRKVKDQNERQEFIQTQTGTPGRISVADVKKIGSKNPATEPDEHEFDDDDDDFELDDEEIINPEDSDKAEAKLCVQVIQNLDWIAVAIANVEKGLRKDLETRLEYCQRDMEQIHKYVKRKK